MRVLIASLAAVFLATPALAAPARPPAPFVQKAYSAFTVHTVAAVPKTPREVWAELIAPAHWWSKDHSSSGDAANLYMDAQAGGCFCELLSLDKDAPEGARRGSVEHMRVIYSDPGKAMRLSGALGPLQGEAVVATLTIRLKPTPSGTRVDWEYVVGGYIRHQPVELAKGLAAVLAQQLASLATLLGAATEDSPDRNSDGTLKSELLFTADSDLVSVPGKEDLFSEPGKPTPVLDVPPDPAPDPGEGSVTGEALPMPLPRADSVPPGIADRAIPKANPVGQEANPAMPVAPTATPAARRKRP